MCIRDSHPGVVIDPVVRDLQGLLLEGAPLRVPMRNVRIVRDEQVGHVELVLADVEVLRVDGARQHPELGLVVVLAVGMYFPVRFHAAQELGRADI